jgi:hypothetical protein
MVLKSGTDVNRRVGVTAILLAGLLTGCASREGLRVAGLPGQQYLVGGALNIGWQAPEAGTVYLIEKRTGKLVETRSMAGGDTYSFTIDSVVRAQELGHILGINPARAQFLLYFEPAGEALSEQARLTR